MVSLLLRMKTILDVVRDKLPSRRKDVSDDLQHIPVRQRRQCCGRPVQIEIGHGGNIILKRDYLMDCMRDFAADGQAAGARWYTAGPLLKSGHPHHPLYLRKDTKLLDFDITAYLKR